MRLTNLKYLIAYIISLSGFFAIFCGGWWSYLTLIIAFGIIPIVEFFVVKSKVNLDEEIESDINEVKSFSWLLYLNVPLVYGWLYACSVGYQVQS